MLKHLSLILIILCVCETLSSQHTVYYSTVWFVETPLSPIQGSKPLSFKESRNRHHYRFNYSQKNELISIAFFNGSTRKRPNHTSNLFTLSHKMVFEKDLNHETISFFDTNLKPVAVLGQVAKFIYELDEFGRRVKLHFEGPNKQAVENSWGISNYDWVYSRNGYVVEDRFNARGEQVSIRPGFDFYRLKLFFDPNGAIRLMQNIDQDGNLLNNSSGAAQDLITVNSEGNFVKWEVLDKEGNLEKGNGPNVAIGIQTFDEFGYETGLKHLDELQNRMYSDYGIAESRSKYDVFGNLSERTFFGLTNQPSPHKEAGYTHLKLFYDEKGNYRTRLEYYGQDETLIEHKTRGYAVVTYKHNEKNQLVEIAYLNSKKQLVKRLDNGVAMIKYQFDNDGKIIKTIKFDDILNQIK